MQFTPASASAIPTPQIDTDEPVAVIPAASVAPLDGDTEGDRINTFILAPKERVGMGAFADKGASELRSRVSARPFTYLAAAFSLGYLIARVTR